MLFGIFSSLREATDAALVAIEQPFIRAYVRSTVQDPDVTARESFDFWRAQGAPLHVCWSCLGNERRETGFNWTAVGDRGTAHGIAQWHLPRILFILNGDPRRGIKGTGIDVRTAGHKGQLSAMLWELKQVGLWDDLLAAKDVQAACDVLVRRYERPAQIERDIKLQVGFANELRAKHPDWEALHVPPTVVAAPAPLPVPAVVTKPKGAFPKTLDRAGAFQVVQDPCPHFTTSVNLAAPRAGVLHTTEGYWTGAMGVFKQHFAPHFLVGLNAQKKPQISQLVPIGGIGAALKAHNDLAIVQVEMVSFSKEQLWLPDDGTLEAMASLMAACRDAYGIPLSHPWPDGDFGRAGDNPHRHAGRYGKIAGWFGHGDVPQPDSHWDPGALRWSKLFDRAKAIGGPDAAPVASRPVPSSASPVVKEALNPPAQPTRGPSPAQAGATEAATQEGSQTMEGLLGSVASMVFGAAGKVGTVATVARYAPNIIEGSFRSIDEAERGAAELVKLGEAVRNGKWQEVPEHFKAILTEFRQIMKNFGIDHDNLNAAAKKIADTDSLATLKSRAA